jgi:ribosomal protein S18 acetylase RimI-like enzyme
VNAWAVRGYDQRDERSWLRCRVLGFLDTCYFDDVVVAKPRYPDPAVDLVAVVGADVVGLLDVVVAGGLATIETIAVHPDHRWRGIATDLLDHALTRLHDLGATEMDAWTREDQPALRWYAAHGFTEAEHYVHVHASREEAAQAAQPVSGLTIAGAFLHAPAASEQRLRQQFARVYRCSRFRRTL